MGFEGPRGTGASKSESDPCLENCGLLGTSRVSADALDRMASSVWTVWTDSVELKGLAQSTPLVLLECSLHELLALHLLFGFVSAVNTFVSGENTFVT